ncbi:efflux RND transporter periplasmic adaptor subunit [Alteromonas sp. ASW11-130]|uniref:efflux RND transporter periplasmic adaptor subunit n=1 Tax=Alteromonas sp. ASW11-130 TaxID=3015775 RepID=UPI002242C068|nr:efflux RND transporter periplasmic adaptor subunit [Alteromonas sp. ASW11-130]MCW8090518.1 efflux RND transporter periplasmic adaptor subunit [Alteromonas sp. ASW11-130]
MSRLVFSPLVIAVVLLAGLLAYLYLPTTGEQQRKSASATPVKVAVVQEQAFPITVEALGTAKARESITITSPRTEVIQNINFEDGDVIEAGQLLVQLNNSEELARIKELEANIAEAERQLVRVKNLAKSSSASEQLLGEQKAKVQTLQAQLDVANAQLNELAIKAPFSGLLGLRQVSNGALVQPGDVITTLDDTSIIKVDFSVAEAHLASLAKGQTVVALSSAYPSETFEGEISTVGTRVDPVSRSVQVRALVDNADRKLRPGMLLKITLQKRVLNTLVLPEKALVPVEDKQYVFVVDGEKVRQQEVKIGVRRPGLVQIIKGLSAGERVVTEGTLRVRDKSAVRILNDTAGE